MIYGDWDESEIKILEELLTDKEKEFINKTAPEWSATEREQKLYPAYHFTSPHGCLNDPNGLCFWQGYYHLFYQVNFGEGWMWAHAASRDLVHWKHLPRAITPGVEKECYSGMILIEEDRAIAAYFGYKIGIMIAVSTDPLLVRWEKLNGGNPVIPLTSPDGKENYIAYDPCIWKNGDKYCLISGKYTQNEYSKSRERQGFLFESSDLLRWDYKGTLLENDLFALPDDDLACPYFLPCGDRHVLLHFSHHSGPKAIVGDYDRERNRFVVTGGRNYTSSPSQFGGLLAPSAFPSVSGDGTLTAIHNVYTVQNEPEGYYQNSIMSLPRTVSLAENNKNEIETTPAKELQLLRVAGSRVEKTDILLKANESYEWEDVKGNTAELIAEFSAKKNAMIELRLMMSDDGSEYSAVRIYRDRGDSYCSAFAPGEDYCGAYETVVTLDTAYSSEKAFVRAPETQSLYLKPDEKLNVHVFLDNSIIEVFVNKKVALTARVAPVKDGKRIAIISRCADVTLEKLEKYELSL